VCCHAAVYTYHIHPLLPVPTACSDLISEAADPDGGGATPVDNVRRLLQLQALATARAATGGSDLRSDSVVSADSMSPGSFTSSPPAASSGPLATLPVFETSARTAAGVAALREWLVGLAPPRRSV